MISGKFNKFKLVSATVGGAVVAWRVIAGVTQSRRPSCAATFQGREYGIYAYGAAMPVTPVPSPAMELVIPQ